MTRRPSLYELCRLMLKHGAFTVGGGSVTMIALERDIVETQQWLTLSRFRTIYGLARLTPGTSILALATGIGWEFSGWGGALVILLVTAVPGSILAALLASGYQEVYGNPTARKVLAGAAAAVCGLIAVSLWKMLQPYLDRDVRSSSLAVLAVAGVLALFEVNPFPVIVCLGIAGYLLAGKDQ